MTQETQAQTPHSTRWYWYVWAVVICTPAWLSWAADFHWFLELFTHFRAQYILGLCVLGLPLLWKQRYALTAIIALTILSQLVVVVPLFFGGDARAATKGTKTHKLLLANVHSANRNYHHLLGLVKKENPDVLVLLEITSAWSDALQPLRKVYDKGATLPQVNNFGIAVLSRQPLRKLKMHRFGAFGVPSLSMQVKLGGRWAWLVGTHPLPPIGGEMARSRNRQMQRLGAFLHEKQGPRILAGDLNATSWSPAFTRLVKQTGLRDSRKGLGIQPTWKIETLLFALPIDHILVSKEVQIHRRFVGPDIGSDHRPVILEFSWKRAR